MNALPFGMLSSAPLCFHPFLFSVLSLVACYPSIAFARPTGGLLRRQSDGTAQSTGNGNGNGVSANIWVRVNLRVVMHRGMLKPENHLFSYQY